MNIEDVDMIVVVATLLGHPEPLTATDVTKKGATKLLRELWEANSRSPFPAAEVQYTKGRFGDLFHAAGS